MCSDSGFRPISSHVLTGTQASVPSRGWLGKRVLPDPACEVVDEEYRQTLPSSREISTRMIATSLLLRIVVLVMRDSDSGKNGDLWMLDTFLEDLCGPLEVVGQPCPFHFLPTEDVQFAYESLSPIQTAQRIGFTAYGGARF